MKWRLASLVFALASACASPEPSLGPTTAPAAEDVEALREGLDTLRASLDEVTRELEQQREMLRSIAQHTSWEPHAGGRPEEGVSIEGDGEGSRIVSVFYGTDRAPTGKQLPDPVYSSERRLPPLPELDYGVCRVSIPPNHQKGEHERPKWWKLQFSEDPEKHIVITSVSPMERDPFFQALVGELAQSTRREAFIFIHGYNVTFEDAVRTTAQLAFDLALDGAPILYSWPSHGGMEDYVADNGQVKWTTPNFKRFLADVASRSGASKIHLIAHSLGNSTLREAVQALVQADPMHKLLSDIVLAAPDVDAGEFVRDYVPALRAVASRVTLYASEKDLALKASHTLWQRPRIGETLTVIDGVDTIDATDAGDGWFGHSYLIESPDVINDIGTMIRRNAAPAARETVVAVPGRQWWKLTQGN